MGLPVKNAPVENLESAIPQTNVQSTASTSQALDALKAIQAQVGSGTAFPSFESALIHQVDAKPDGDFTKVKSHLPGTTEYFVWNILPNTMDKILSGQIAIFDVHFVQSKKGKIDADTSELMIYAVTKSSDHVSSKVFS